MPPRSLLKCRYLRSALVIGLLGASALPASGQVGAEPAELHALMEALAKARQFGDRAALRLLHTPEYLSAIQDTATARVVAFRIRYPKSRIEADNPDFRRFMEESWQEIDRRTLEVLATAYRQVDRGDPDRDAALQILAYIYNFPSSPVTIATSSYSFARIEGSKAYYYLSEDWQVPMAAGVIPKRFVVEWLKIGPSSWVLNQLQ